MEEELILVLDDVGGAPLRMLEQLVGLKAKIKKPESPVSRLSGLEVSEPAEYPSGRSRVRS